MNYESSKSIYKHFIFYEWQYTLSSLMINLFTKLKICIRIINFCFLYHKSGAINYYFQNILGKDILISELKSTNYKTKNMQVIILLIKMKKNIKLIQQERGETLNNQQNEIQNIKIHQHKEIQNKENTKQRWISLKARIRIIDLKAQGKLIYPKQVQQVNLKERKLYSENQIQVKKVQLITKVKKSEQKLMLINLPVPLISNILSYLNLADYNHFNSTCSLIHEVFYLKSSTYTKTMNYEALESANIMCWECKIDILEEPMEIMMIKFTFLTRDQGWASASYSTSWIEAEFLDRNGLNIVRKNDPRKQKDRLYLVDNFVEPHYKQKSKTIKDRSLLADLYKIKIYLRSQFPGWRIYCKRADISIMYASSLYQS